MRIDERIVRNFARIAQRHLDDFVRKKIWTIEENYARNNGGDRRVRMF